MKSTFFILVCSVLFLSSCAHFKKVGWVLSSNPSPHSPESIQRGSGIYKNYCLSCHGLTARGDGPAKNQLLTQPADLIAVAKKRWDSTFAAHVAFGKAGNKEMPKFESTLTEQEVWDVTNYIYSLK